MNHERLMRCQLLCLLLGTPLLIKSYDEIHRYRPPLFFGEPQLARDGLIECGITINHGSTHYARNCNDEKIPLFDMCTTLPKDPPSTTTIETCDHILCAGYICRGSLSLTECIITWSQNFARGFFTSGYIPLRSLHSTHPPFLEAQGLGDIACAIGWTVNYEETKRIDFIDFTAQAGVALPTSPIQPLLQGCTDALGYQGRTGYFFILDGSCGLLDWLNFGGHIQCLCFTDKSLPFLSHRSPACTAGIYTKADHVVLGLSCTLGYSFTHQGAIWGKELPPARIFQSCFAPWSMHTIHFRIDYDFATYDNPYAPCLGLVYNNAVRGKNIFPIPLTGGAWDFTIVLQF